MSVNNPQFHDINIMLDIECLGLVAGSKILQIGACVVGTEFVMRRGCMPGFEVTINAHHQTSFSVDKEAVEWWNDPVRKETKDKVFNGRVVLPTALRDLHAYILEVRNKYHVADTAYSIWSLGADFDIAALAYAYTHYGAAVPWHYTNTRCYRTLRAMYRHLLPASGTTKADHTALADAQHQAIELGTIMRQLAGGR